MTNKDKSDYQEIWESGFERGYLKRSEEEVKKKLQKCEGCGKVFSNIELTFLCKKCKELK